VNVFKPMQLVGASAVGMVALEKFVTRKPFIMSWPESYALLGLFAACSLSVFTAYWPGLAFESTIQFANILVIYFLMVNTVTTKTRLQILLWLWAVGSLMPARGSISGYMRGWGHLGRIGWEWIFHNPNDLAVAMVIIVPLLASLIVGASKIVQLLAAGMFLTYFAGAYVTFSRQGMLGLAAVVFLLAIRDPRPLARVVLIAALIVGIVFVANYWERDQGFTNLTQDKTFQGRLEGLETGLELFFGSPLFGVGLGCAGLGAVRDAGPLWDGRMVTIHNTPMQILAETGIVGLLFFTIAMGASILHCRRVRARRDPRYGERGQDRLANYAAGLEVSFWGFLVASMAGPFLETWFPYLLMGLASAISKIARAEASSEPAGHALPV
jgi:O-antigen ligase